MGDRSGRRDGRSLAAFECHIVATRHEAVIVGSAPPGLTAAVIRSGAGPRCSTPRGRLAAAVAFRLGPDSTIECFDLSIEHSMATVAHVVGCCPGVDGRRRPGTGSPAIESLLQTRDLPRMRARHRVLKWWFSARSVGISLALQLIVERDARTAYWPIAPRTPRTSSEPVLSLDIIIGKGFVTSRKSEPPIQVSAAPVRPSSRIVRSPGRRAAAIHRQNEVLRDLAFQGRS
jgi:hypothetical protein